MYSPPNTIATRGILNNNSIVLPVAGWLILSVKVKVIRRRSGGGGGAPVTPYVLPLGYPEPVRKKQEVVEVVEVVDDQIVKQQLIVKHQIEVKILFNNIVYTDIQYVSENVEVSKKDIEVVIIDNKPIVKIKFLK